MFEKYFEKKEQRSIRREAKRQGVDIAKQFDALDLERYASKAVEDKGIKIKISRFPEGLDQQDFTDLVGEATERASFNVTGWVALRYSSEKSIEASQEMAPLHPATGQVLKMAYFDFISAEEEAEIFDESVKKAF